MSEEVFLTEVSAILIFIFFSIILPLYLLAGIIEFWCRVTGKLAGEVA